MLVLHEGTFMILRILSFCAALAILIVQILWIRNNKSKWYYAMPVMVWMIHTLVFYAIVISKELLTGEYALSHFYTMWSSILRLHGLSSLLALEIFRWTNTNRKGNA